jgi:hypothetical protein
VVYKDRPVYVDNPQTEHTITSLTTALKQTTTLLANTQNRLDKATQYLCYVMGSLKEGGTLTESELPHELRVWARDHHLEDTSRLALKIRDLAKGVTSQELYEKLIREAEAVHPLSEWHKEWFKKMVNTYHGPTR